MAQFNIISYSNPVQIDSGALQAADELAVRDLAGAASGIDAHNP
jgi:hypothetical protein